MGPPGVGGETPPPPGGEKKKWGTGFFPHQAGGGLVKKSILKTNSAGKRQKPLILVPVFFPPIYRCKLGPEQGDPLICQRPLDGATLKFRNLQLPEIRKNKGGKTSARLWASHRRGRFEGRYTEGRILRSTSKSLGVAISITTATAARHPIATTPSPTSLPEQENGTLRAGRFRRHSVQRRRYRPRRLVWTPPTTTAPATPV